MSEIMIDSALREEDSWKLRIELFLIDFSSKIFTKNIWVIIVLFAVHHQMYC